MGKENDLLEAARLGNIAVIEKLLSAKSKSKWPTSIQTLSFLKGPNVSCQDQNGETPLHFAALNNHKEIVELLLKYQASANIPDQKGCYPLHLAAWRGNFEICQILLTNGPSVAIINNQNLDGDTALHSAAQYGHTDVVNVLLQKCANPWIKNAKGEKALDLAVMFGRQETVERLLNNPDSKIYLNLSKQDKSPLHLAAKSGNINVMRMLLSAGFNVNHLTDSGTALHEASLHGKLEVFKLLLSQGGDVMLTNSDHKTTIDHLNELSNPVAAEMKKLVLDFDNEKMRTAQKNIDNTKFFSVGEDYDILPKVAEKHQGIDSVSHLSRNSVGSSTSSVFQGTGEEESIYDCPQAGARALFPLQGTKTPLVSSSFNKIEKPNTPKKPPRKKIVNNSSKAVEKQTTTLEALPDGCLSDRTDGTASSYGTPIGSFNSNKTSTGSSSTKLPTPPSNPPQFRPHISTTGVNSDFSATTIITSSTNSSPKISSSNNHMCSVSVVPPSSNDSSRNNSIETTHQQGHNLGMRPGHLMMNSKELESMCEPPTPDHPPPSPETALLDIQQLINSERRKSRDMHTSTEFEEPKISSDRVRPQDNWRETIHNSSRNFPLMELNNNNSIFHGLTLGSSPLSTISPTRKSMRMQRFNQVMMNSSLTHPSFLPSVVPRPPRSDITDVSSDVRSQGNNWDVNSGSNIGQSHGTNSQIANELDGPSEAKEDWTQFEHLFKSPLIDGLEVLMNDFDQRMTTILSDEGSKCMLSVTDWLESINMSQFENILIINGFDDMQFMILLEPDDMEEIGIKNKEHRSLLSNQCRLLPPPPEPRFESMRSWLESLRLSEYYDMFCSQGCSEIAQFFEFSDSQLQNVFKYMLLGHRKRMKHSMQYYFSKYQIIAKVLNDTRVEGKLIGDACYRKPESLITGCCNYTVRYLGSKQVSVAHGIDPPKFAIAKIKDNLTCIDEMPTVTLSISYLGVRFIDLENKTMICSHDIGNIFSASQGEDSLNYFAYITQSFDDGPFLCHVFHARSEDLAREIMMTLGEAFYVAYQLALRDQDPSKVEEVEEDAETSKVSRESEFLSTTTPTASITMTTPAAPISMTTSIKSGHSVDQKHHHANYQSRSTEI